VKEDGERGGELKLIREKKLMRKKGEKENEVEKVD
jgi:hypothetical protein